MARIEPGGEEAKGGDHREIQAIADGDELRPDAGVDLGEGREVAGVDLGDVRGFVDDLRLVVAHRLHLVRDFVEGGLADDDADEFLAAEGHAVALDAAGGAAGVGERIVGKLRVERGEFGVVGVAPGVEWRGERLRHGDLVDAVFGERDADGVADAVAEQAADADRGFDAAVFPVTGLGHAEVDGVGPGGRMRDEG